MTDVEEKIYNVFTLTDDFEKNFSDFDFSGLNGVAFLDGYFPFIKECVTSIEKYLEGGVDAELFINFLNMLSKVFEQLIKNKKNLVNSYNYCVDIYNLSTELYEKSKDKGLPNKNYLVKLKRFLQDLNEPIYKLNISKDRKIAYLEDCFNREIILMNATGEIDKGLLANFKHLLSIYFQEEDPVAYYIYGICLSELNNCFKPNYQAALRCFLTATKSGNYKAFIKAGDLYYGGHLDSEKTFYRKAYECYIDSLLIEENEQARFRLSDMYLNGHHVAQSKDIAFKLISTSMKNVDEFYENMNFSSCYPEVSYRYAKLLHEMRLYEDHNTILALLKANHALEERRKFVKSAEDQDLFDGIRKELANFSQDKINDTIAIHENNHFSKRVKLAPDNLYLIKHNENFHFIGKYIREEEKEIIDVTTYKNYVFEVVEVTSSNDSVYNIKEGAIYNLNFANYPKEITKYKPHILTVQEKGFIAVESQRDLENAIYEANLPGETSNLKLVCNYDLDHEKDEVIFSYEKDGKSKTIKFIKCSAISFPFKSLENAKIVEIKAEIQKELGNIFRTCIDYVDEEGNEDTLEITSSSILYK